MSGSYDLANVNHSSCTPLLNISVPVSGSLVGLVVMVVLFVVSHIVTTVIIIMFVRKSKTTAVK